MDADDSNNAAHAAGSDARLSRLDDAALGHILSFLPAVEAARAATLSRRWRHVFAAMHTLSFRESDRPFSMGYRWFELCSYCDPGDPDRVRPPRLVSGVGAALLGRHRGGPHAAAALRALRVAFDEYGFKGGDEARNTVDGWLSYAAAYRAGGNLEIDLRLDGGEPICKRAYSLLLPPGLDGGGEQEQERCRRRGLHRRIYRIYITPKSLFSCAALRSLRLAGCGLDLPSTIALPSLETLHLTRITDGSRTTGGGAAAVQRLVSACPRLADLTLEACGGGSNLTVLSVPGTARLRRLALRCCHDLAAVNVGDSSELRAFEYRGGVPKPTFLTMHGSARKISFCTIDLCDQGPAGTPELISNLLHFIRLFAGVERVHLTSARLGCGIGRGAFSFPALRKLELTGMLPEDDDTASITAVTRILERTPSLETLSLFFLPDPYPMVDTTGSYMTVDDEEAIHAAHELRYDRHVALTVPDVDIPCLRERMREINFVHYQGAMAQRMLAKFLLRNAPVVDEVWCEFARGPLSIQTKLMGEIKGWVLNKSAKMMFC
ncbi:unnamed protein product [Urochloa decumbens]|uniref:F-box domain-containing protein n=1 Tax=Urochloa decumbens TaxID=240449 RepID=A0ABC9AYV9_9POAL